MCSTREAERSASVQGLSRDEEDGPTPRHTDGIALRPAEPPGLYYSFGTVRGSAKGRGKSMDGGGKERERTKRSQ